MKLTSRGRYALQALVDLVIHSSGRPARLQDIADRQGISLFYLEQIFRQLRLADLVRSVRGPGGGYVLTMEPDKMPIYLILTALKENMSHYEDPESGVKPTTELEAIKKYLSCFDDAVRGLLEKTLGDLVKNA